MTDAKLPKLADGSRWDIDGKVIDKDGDLVACVNYLTCGGVLELETESGEASCFVADALAVIRRAGLDPLAIAAKELVGEIRSRITGDCTGDQMVYLDHIKAELQKLEALL